MHFDDGENPWRQTENFIKIFDWDFFKSGSMSVHSIFGSLLMICGVALLLR